MGIAPLRTQISLRLGRVKTLPYGVVADHPPALSGCPGGVGDGLPRRLAAPRNDRREGRIATALTGLAMTDGTGDPSPTEYLMSHILYLISIFWGFFYGKGTVEGNTGRTA